MKLGNPLFELAVTYTIFNLFNTFYQARNNIYLGGYNKNSFDKDGKIIIPTIEKILKLLMDKKSWAKVLLILESTIVAFKAFQKKAK